MKLLADTCILQFLDSIGFIFGDVTRMTADYNIYRSHPATMDPCSVLPCKRRTLAMQRNANVVSYNHQNAMPSQTFSGRGFLSVRLGNVQGTAHITCDNR
jgi:hypothetical protein